MKHERTILNISLGLAIASLALLPFAAVAFDASHQDQRAGFIANKGQVHDQFGRPNQAVQYLYNGPGMNVQLRKCGFSYDTYSVREEERTQGLERARVKDLQVGMDTDTAPMTYDFHRIDIHFVNGDPQATIVQQGESEDYTNYYTDVTGEAGATFVRSYSTVTYHDVWPKIDVRFNSGEDGFKYDVIVHPGGDLNDARFKVEGAAISESQKGRLVLDWGSGSLEELIPDSWMEQGRRKERVNARYRMEGSDRFGFAVDRSSSGTLVIDPSPIIWGTYLGSAGLDESRAVALGTDQFSLVTGYTTSFFNMATSGAFDISYNTGGDAYLVKFDPNGARAWSTYFGGLGKDEGNSVALGPNGDVVIVGTTASLSGIASAGAFQPALGLAQSTDGFIARFSSAGTRVWSTYYGGSQSDQLYAVSVSTAGHIAVCGYAISPDALGTPGTADPSWNGGGDAFIGSFTWSGSRLWGTYLGGNEGTHDDARGIAFIGTTGLLVTGSTEGVTGIATNTAGRHDGSFSGGGLDGYLARYDMTGAKVWCTYYGGSGYDMAYDVDHIGLNQVAICGHTSSTNAMSTPGAQQGTHGGGGKDGFVAVFTISNGSRVWGSYHGTGLSEELRSLAATNNGHFCVGGLSQGFGTGAFVADYRNDGVLYYEPGLTTQATHCTVAANVDLLVAAGTTAYTGGYGFPSVHQPVHGGGGGDGFHFRLHYALVPLGILPRTEDDHSTSKMDTIHDATSASPIIQLRGDQEPVFTQITVWDMQGRIVLERSLDRDELVVDLSLGLRPGVHIVMLDGPLDARKTMRFVIP
jgi:hypothetical protein